MADRRHTDADGKRPALHKANQRGQTGLANAGASMGMKSGEGARPGEAGLKKRPKTTSRSNDR